MMTLWQRGWSLLLTEPSFNNNQYQAGTVAYLNVLVAQSTALANERTALGIVGQRLAASVLLIKALGGGWNSRELR